MIRVRIVGEMQGYGPLNERLYASKSRETWRRETLRMRRVRGVRGDISRSLRVSLRSSQHTSVCELLRQDANTCLLDKIIFFRALCCIVCDDNGNENIYRQKKEIEAMLQKHKRAAKVIVKEIRALTEIITCV